MNPYSISGLVLGFTCLFLVFFIIKFGKSKLHQIWVVFNFSVAIWGFGAFLIGRSHTEVNAVVYWRIAHIGSLCIAILFYHTVCLFCKISRKRVIIFAYAQLLFFELINFIDLFFGSSLLISKIDFILNSLFYVQAENLFYCVMFFIWTGFVCLGHYELIVFYRKASGGERNQTRYLFFGFLVGFLGGMTNFLPMFKLNIYPIGNFTIPLYCIIVTYAILKYRLMDIKVFISRAFAFFISYPFLLAIPFIIGYRFYPILFSKMGRHWWLVPSGILVVIATFAPIVYGQIRRKVEEALLAEQKKYQKLLLQAASGMVTEHNLDKLAKLIVYIVKRSVGIKFSAIFLDDKKEGVYRLKALRDSGEINYKNITFLYEHPFVKYVKKTKDPFYYGEMPKYIRNSLSVLDGVDLVIPSTIEDNLLGFVFLGEKTNRQAYTEDDINVFKILSNQAALAVENCIFLQEFKQAQERIFTAEKLASIGGMADGVAHQIKNRLNQFSVASGELKYEIKDFLAKRPKLIEKDPDIKKTLDYMSEIADSLIKNVKKTDGIIKGILNFARVEEKETFFSRFSLKEVIDMSADLLKVKHEINELPLKVNLDSSDLIYGVKAQITESVYNILDNSYEAVMEKRSSLSSEEKSKFKAQLEIKLTQQTSSYLIEVIDNGVGIHKRDEHKIFAPFFTTKSSYKSGTGIGMYVVKRMVEENHKGKVWFDTEHGIGTHFYIKLPRK